jgi:ribonuclease inhibitor
MRFQYALMLMLGLFFSLQVMAAGTVLIEGKELKNRDEMHALVAKNLKFPTYYLKTLDSLYDILSTDFTGDTIIKFKHINILKAKLGPEYVDSLVSTIMDAAEDNHRLILLLE